MNACSRVRSRQPANLVDAGLIEPAQHTAQFRDVADRYAVAMTALLSPR